MNDALSPREKQVLQLRGRGFSSSRIAKELGISLGTVKTHVKNIRIRGALSENLLGRTSLKMTIGNAGLSLIKGDEGLRLSTYDDATGKPVPEGGTAEGKLTIGYGHTGMDVHPGMQITLEQASELLGKDVLFAERAVSRYVTSAINQNQFDALVCFTFNCGVGSLIQSTLLKKVNAGDFAGAQAEFVEWNHSNGKVLAGLTRRRADEAKLFGTPWTETTSS